MRRTQVIKVVAVALPLAVTTVLLVLSKFGDEGDLMGLTPSLAIAQLAGLYSVMLMAIALLITTRSRMIETLYGGLDKSYRLHARLGEVALVLMLVHLLTLIPETPRLSTLFVPFTDAWAKSVAIIAFWAFAVLAALALWRGLSYQTWLAVHTWIGLPFLLVSVHAFGATSDIRAYEPLRFWMLLWVTLGGAAWIYRTFIYHAVGPRYDYRVEEVTERGNGTWDLVLRPTSVRMNYEPGKFAFISVKNLPEIPAEHHPFSISSSPVHRELRFSFKACGDYTRALPTAQKGTRIEVYGPFGQFTLHQLGEFRRLIWVAGGIGITPFLSMLAFEATNDDFRKIWLFYSVRRNEDAVFDGEIEQQISSADSYIDYVKWISEERGPLTADAILEITGPVDDYAIMICGPPAMARAVKKQFVRKGFRAGRIVFEDFAFH